MSRLPDLALTRSRLVMAERAVAPAVGPRALLDLSLSQSENPVTALSRRVCTPAALLRAGQSWRIATSDPAVYYRHFGDVAASHPPPTARMATAAIDVQAAQGYFGSARIAGWARRGARLDADRCRIKCTASLSTSTPFFSARWSPA
jgi:hypothetical protein